MVENIGRRNLLSMFPHVGKTAVDAIRNMAITSISERPSTFLDKFDLYRRQFMHLSGSLLAGAAFANLTGSREVDNNTDLTQVFAKQFQIPSELANFQNDLLRLAEVSNTQPQDYISPDFVIRNIVNTNETTYEVIYTDSRSEHLDRQSALGLIKDQNQEYEKLDTTGTWSQPSPVHRHNPEYNNVIKYYNDGEAIMTYEHSRSGGNGKYKFHVCIGRYENGNLIPDPTQPNSSSYLQNVAGEYIFNKQAFYNDLIKPFIDISTIDEEVLEMQGEHFELNNADRNYVVAFKGFEPNTYGLTHFLNPEDRPLDTCKEDKDRVTYLHFFTKLGSPGANDSEKALMYYAMKHESSHYNTTRFGIHPGILTEPIADADSLTSIQNAPKTDSRYHSFWNGLSTGVKDVLKSLTQNFIDMHSYNLLTGGRFTLTDGNFQYWYSLPWLMVEHYASLVNKGKTDLPGIIVQECNKNPNSSVGVNEVMTSLLNLDAEENSSGNYLFSSYAAAFTAIQMARRNQINVNYINAANEAFKNSEDSLRSVFRANEIMINKVNGGWYGFYQIDSPHENRTEPPVFTIEQESTYMKNIKDLRFIVSEYMNSSQDAVMVVIDLDNPNNFSLVHNNQRLGEVGFLRPKNDNEVVRLGYVVMLNTPDMTTQPSNNKVGFELKSVNYFRNLFLPRVHR